MDCNFKPMKQIIEENHISKEDWKRLVVLFDGDNEPEPDEEDMDDFMNGNSTEYLVIDSWEFDDFIYIARWGKNACLDIQNKGYRCDFHHYVDDESMEKNIEDQFYKFEFIDSEWGDKETIFIYPLNY